MIRDIQSQSTYVYILATSDDTVMSSGYGSYTVDAYYAHGYTQL